MDAKRVLREVKLLKHFKHENVCLLSALRHSVKRAGAQVVQLLDMIDPPSLREFHDM